MKAKNEEQAKRIEELERANVNLQKETSIYKAFLMSEKIELDFSEIEQILKKSEEELEGLKELEQKDKNLMESLRIRRATIETKKRGAGDVSDVAKFFEKRKSGILKAGSYADHKLF